VQKILSRIRNFSFFSILKNKNNSMTRINPAPYNFEQLFNQNLGFTPQDSKKASGSVNDPLTECINKDSVDKWIIDWIIECTRKPSQEIKRLLDIIDQLQRENFELETKITLLQDILPHVSQIPKKEVKPKRKCRDDESIEVMGFVDYMEQFQSNRNKRVKTDPGSISSTIPVISHTDTYPVVHDPYELPTFEISPFGESIPVNFEMPMFEISEGGSMSTKSQVPSFEIIASSSSTAPPEPEFNSKSEPTPKQNSKGRQARQSVQSNDNALEVKTIKNNIYDTNNPPRNERKRKNRPFCNIENCSRFGIHQAKEADGLGNAGVRCAKHYILCGVNGCTEQRYVHTAATDVHGVSGPRCRKHYYETCNVEGCTNLGNLQKKEADANGGPGSRCSKHMLGRCTVQGCNTVGYNLTTETDQFGDAGTRCAKHFFGPCVVTNCKKVGYNLIQEADDHGDAGRRCHDHFIKVCNVDGCKENGHAVIDATDNFGEPGPRCAKHIMEGCNVTGCFGFAYDRVTKKDRHAGPGPRCHKHFAKLCPAPGCKKNGIVQAELADEFGEPGLRCFAHYTLPPTGPKEESATKKKQ